MNAFACAESGRPDNLRLQEVEMPVPKGKRIDPGD